MPHRGGSVVGGVRNVWLNRLCSESTQHTVQTSSGRVRIGTLGIIEPAGSGESYIQDIPLGVVCTPNVATDQRARRVVSGGTRSGRTVLVLDVHRTSSHGANLPHRCSSPLIVDLLGSTAPKTGREVFRTGIQHRVQVHARHLKGTKRAKTDR